MKPKPCVREISKISKICENSKWFIEIIEFENRTPGVEVSDPTEIILQHILYSTLERNHKKRMKCPG